MLIYILFWMFNGLYYTLLYQLLDSNLFTHRNTYAILREATSETYGHYINLLSTSYLYYHLFCNLYFPIYIIKIPKILSYHIYQISLLQVAVKGLTTPLSCWLQGSYLFV